MRICESWFAVVIPEGICQKVKKKWGVQYNMEVVTQKPAKNIQIFAFIVLNVSPNFFFIIHPNIYKNLNSEKVPHHLNCMNSETWHMAAPESEQKIFQINSWGKYTRAVCLYSWGTSSRAWHTVALHEYLKKNVVCFIHTTFLNVMGKVRTSHGKKKKSTLKPFYNVLLKYCFILKNQ